MKNKIFNSKGFTLIEILIVISIIAILASTVGTNFIGFDSEARIAATQSNLESIRMRIEIFRAKEGRFPDTLTELTNTFYLDMGVKRAYLKKMPGELVSNSAGNMAVVILTSTDDLTNEGGWVYVKDLAEVKVNLSDPLSKKWGKFSGELPSEW
ncbi:MAG: prepilin-type N-terminal cleavage/methylation domain-containing protein [Candidatus Omnitrophica bacterium]|nr:prepilin-type N-terminal cleavage/methylation domain-containing protein [Candidatus Omnitrophota bacterium]